MSELPTLYEYYTAGGVTAGLSADKPIFSLNYKDITLVSGAVHYFRVHPTHWRDRLKKVRAAGLNAVETYVPWNLHEPQCNQYDFGNASSEFSEFLDIKKFIEIAQDEDLFVIVRPGPYICAEWEFGGLPSWLLRHEMKIRTSDPKFIDFVRNYFKQLLTILAPLQFTRGGPIIAFQIENEYGNTKTDTEPIDSRYLEILKEIMEENGIKELFFTSDTPSNGFSGTLPGVLATANFQERPVFELSLLKEFQPDRPLMVMEYWTGWFDHWSEKHHTRSVKDFGQTLEEILNFGSSVNMYMFHGGTNWGFLNGANIKDSSTDNSAYQPDTSSYDYDAPLSEAGDYTDKYFKVKELAEKFIGVKTKLPEIPKLIPRIAYPEIRITGMLTAEDLLKNVKTPVSSQKLLAMELLDINNSNGQSYGYVVYTKKDIDIPAKSILKIEGHVCDTILVLINGKLKSKILQSQNDLDHFGYWRQKNSFLDLGEESYHCASLDLIVENWGRSNYGKLNQFNQHKGLWQGNVLINDAIVEDWQIFPLEFRKSWTDSLSNWKSPVQVCNGPALYKADLDIDEVSDTYLDFREWVKGFVIVNGFVLSRYCKLGPQQSVYVPGPFLKKGSNSVLVFEHFVGREVLKFITDPIFETLE